MTVDPELLKGDLVSSAREKLLAALTAADMVGTLIGKDPNPGDPWFDGWVFSGSDNDNAPSRDVANTGLVACVVSQRDAWASNMHNTARFPILQVLTFADSSRIPGTVQRAAEDADLKAKAVARVVRKTFHDAANADHAWPLELEVVSSVAQGDLSITDVPGSDFTVRGQQRFEIQLSDPY